MKYEIEIPEGYEFDNVAYGLFGDNVGRMYVNLKKKKQKDFSFYIDEYLPISDSSTCDKIHDWIESDHIRLMKDRLKTNQFNLVPWEIKIGLFRFICDELKVNWGKFLFGKRSDSVERICSFMPLDFIIELI